MAVDDRFIIGTFTKHHAGGSARASRWLASPLSVRGGTRRGRSPAGRSAGDIVGRLVGATP